MISTDQKFHPVYGITAMCFGVLLGAIFARFWLSGWLVNYFWFFIYIFIAFILLRIGRFWCVVAMLIIGILMGYTRGSSEMLANLPITKFYNQNVKISGVITEDISKTKSGDGAMKLSIKTVADQTASGNLWVVVRAADAVNLRRSDDIILEGKLKEGFGSFSGSMYRAKVIEVKRETAKDPFVDIRDWLSGGIHKHLPEKEAALGAGYILGQKQALPVDFDEALRIVGLTHVMVASGYNLTILVRLARRLFMRVSRYTAAISGVAMTLTFIGITGISPSMMRAGLVSLLSLIAWYYGRKLNPIVLLFFTAAISIMVQPAYIWGDVGWMLSFASFAGVMLFAPVLQAYFYGEKPPGTVRQILGETFSAQLFTLPIILMMFGTLSNVSLIVNLLVLPFIPLAMFMVFVTAITSLWLPVISPLFAAPTLWLLQYMTGIVDIFSELSWASVEVEFSLPMVIVSYLLIGILTTWLYKRSRISYNNVNIVE